MPSDGITKLESWWPPDLFLVTQLFRSGFDGTLDLATLLKFPSSRSWPSEVYERITPIPPPLSNDVLHTFGCEWMQNILEWHSTKNTEILEWQLVDYLVRRYHNINKLNNLTFIAYCVWTIRHIFFYIAL